MADDSPLLHLTWPMLTLLPSALPPVQPLASLVTAQLLFLESEDPEKPCYMYINRYGGDPAMNTVSGREGYPCYLADGMPCTVCWQPWRLSDSRVGDL